MVKLNITGKVVESLKIDNDMDEGRPIAEVGTVTVNFTDGSFLSIWKDGNGKWAVGLH
jgi:hypothetical protein